MLNRIISVEIIQCPEHGIKLHLMVRLQSWSLGNVEYLFIIITLRSTLLSERSDFWMVDNQSITVHDFSMHMLTSLSVDKILLPRYVNKFKRLEFNVDMTNLNVKTVLFQKIHFYVSTVSMSKQFYFKHEYSLSLLVCLLVGLFVFYGISTFEGYFMPNPFLYK